MLDALFHQAVFSRSVFDRKEKCWMGRDATLASIISAFGNSSRLD
jgi:hypothetical protein